MKLASGQIDTPRNSDTQNHCVFAAISLGLEMCTVSLLHL